jgi:hypothetical protein
MPYRIPVHDTGTMCRYSCARAAVLHTGDLNRVSCSSSDVVRPRALAPSGVPIYSRTLGLYQQGWKLLSTGGCVSAVPRGVGWGSRGCHEGGTSSSGFSRLSRLRTVSTSPSSCGEVMQ